MRPSLRLPIRTRLALIYTGLLAAALVVFGAGVFLVLQAQLLASFDTSLVANAEHAAGAFAQDIGADGRLHPTARLLEQFVSTGGRVEILDPSGNLIMDSAPREPALPIPPGDLTATDHSNPAIHSATEAGASLRYVVHPILSASRGIVGYVVWAAPTGPTDNLLRTVALAILLGGTLVTVIAFGFGWWLARRALAPVADLTETARAISLSGDFGGRVQASGSADDEVGELAVAFNEMLGALESNHKALQRFLGDASHQLRTPLTTVRTSLELLDRRQLPADERQALLDDARSETERMARLVADLLALARAESGARLDAAPVQLDEVLLEAVRQAAAAAPHVRMDVESIEAAVVQGDRDRLKELFLIVLENAGRYTPAGGIVSASLRLMGSLVRVEVADNGVGIPEEERERVFERLYRGAEARRLRPSGTGLGLSIASWIAQAHGGRIFIVARESPGTTIAIELPGSGAPA